MQGQAVGLEAEIELMDVRELALAARATAGLSVVDTPLNTTRGVNEYDSHDGASVIDLAGNDPFFLGKT